MPEGACVDTYITQITDNIQSLNPEVTLRPTRFASILTATSPVQLVALPLLGLALPPAALARLSRCLDTLLPFLVALHLGWYRTSCIRA